MAQMANMIDLTDPNAQAAQLDLQRRQQMVDALRQQALSPLQQQTAGGYVVPISPFEGLSKLGQAYIANKAQEKLANQQAQLMQDRSNKIAQALKSYGTTTETTPFDATKLTGMGTDGQVPATFDVKSRPATPEEQMQQDWQLTQLDPSFAKVLEARKAREDAQQARLDQMMLAQQMRQDARMQNMQPYFTPLQTSQGVYSFNARTGKVEPIAGGQGSSQLVGAQYDPRLQGQIAGAKAGAGDIAKQTAEVQVKLPQLVATANDISRHIDEMIGSPNGEIKPHPGMNSYLGSAGLAGYVPKTDAADFKARLDQLTGGTFLQAYNTLRGGGQITEVEGAKATAALNRARAAQNEDQFKSALRDFQNIVNQGAERARQQAQGNYQPPAPYSPAPQTTATPTGAKFLGFE